MLNALIAVSGRGNSTLLHQIRSRGHLLASIDPLGRKVQQTDTSAGSWAAQLQNELNSNGDDPAIGSLKAAYTATVASEIAHVATPAEFEWLAAQIETRLVDKHNQVSTEKKKRILEVLMKSHLLDDFLQKKFPTLKRYGLEGNEASLVAFDSIFSAAGAAGVTDIVLGHAHRGRLNLLTILLQMPPRALFWKILGFKEFPPEVISSADVLSHLVHLPEHNNIHVTLLHNPSHLEAVMPVVSGKVRARQMQLQNPSDRPRILAFTAHGDAALIGQGVVPETLNLSQIPAYTTGGAVRLVVNNQLGFTAERITSRTGSYATQAALMINAPCFHVNANDPLAVAIVCGIAVQYQQLFKKDVFVDVVGFRRRGHNELDEPRFTNPVMYRDIAKALPTHQLFGRELISEGVLAETDIAAMKDAYLAMLDKEAEEAKLSYRPSSDAFAGNWAGFRQEIPADSAPAAAATKATGVDVATLVEVGYASVGAAEIQVHDRILRVHAAGRRQKIDKGEGLDFATAEALAFGSLLREGHPIRISGQDVGRGTFSQRHAVLVDQESGREVIPLNYWMDKLPNNSNSSSSRARMEVCNSPLSEFAVMGYEYGYSLESPKPLVIWEAQFGDFANGAQIIIDTFVSCSEVKWTRQTGLVLALPHGFDGGGPEHSSARIERFLQSCGTYPSVVNGQPNHSCNANMRVIYPSTPANYFHALRRQVQGPYARPLVVAVSKVLLRDPASVSKLSDMAPGTSFQEIIDDEDFASEGNAKQVDTIVFTSGKVYYDLHKIMKKTPERSGKVAKVRLEQIFPLSHSKLQELGVKYSNASKIAWLQEEPANMGCNEYIVPILREVFNVRDVKYVGRPRFPVVAVGWSQGHAAEVAQLNKDIAAL